MTSHERREFLKRSSWTGAALVAAGTLPAAADAAQEEAALPIVDTHQHLWDLERFRLPWLAEAPKVLRQNYRPEEYRQAIRGTAIDRAVYMEVDVDPKQHVAEAEYVVGLCRGKERPTVAAVVGGRPAAAGFPAYVRRLVRDRRHVKGVRQVLHSESAKPGMCLQEDFVRGVRLLGDNNLSFDLCMRPTELRDAVRLTELCPDTRFVLDHCGNADPKVFRKNPGSEKPSHDPAAWRRDIERCAKRPNLVCKISGIVARAPRGWTADDLAPIVNHCLDAFGPDRVLFGGDWPVCLLGAPLRQWVDTLTRIVARRPLADRRKLWSENAVRFYGLER